MGSKYPDLVADEIYGVTPQTKPISKDQVANNAGGFVFELNDFQRLERFLIIGSDSNTYYQDARALTKENAKCVVECWEQDAVRTLVTIATISTSGRAPKNDPAIFALALGATSGRQSVRHEAFVGVNKVCRTATHLFQFVDAVLKLSGKSHMRRGLKNAVRQWYASKSPDQAAYQMIKYRNREGFSHTRMMQMAHPPGQNDQARIALYRWARGLAPTDHDQSVALPNLVKAHLWAMNGDKAPTDKRDVFQLVRDYDLPWEAVPTGYLNSPDLWRILLPKMGLTAMQRELARMTQIGLLKPLSDEVTTVTRRFTDVNEIRKARLHPFNLLMAHAVYKSGKSFKGDRTWTPVPAIVDALEAAFYLSFSTVEPTGKKHLYALDVSGSMSSALMNSPLSCCEGAAALAMTGLRTEPQCHVMAFADGIRDLRLSSADSLDQVTRKTRNVNWGGTDCALPMNWARKNKIEVDTFVVITDNETWAGRDGHPCETLKHYRREMGRPAKLVVIGMTSTGFTIADPKDAGMMDVVGFDSAAPKIIADFARG